MNDAMKDFFEWWDAEMEECLVPPDYSASRRIFLAGWKRGVQSTNKAMQSSKKAAHGSLSLESRTK